jgi:inner membrane transporter RhtA
VFGTLMSLEPALALLIGWLILSQSPGLLQAVGIASVVAAGIGAERAHRSADPKPNGPAGDDDAVLDVDHISIGQEARAPCSGTG